MKNIELQNNTEICNSIVKKSSLLQKSIYLLYKQIFPKERSYKNSKRVNQREPPLKEKKNQYSFYQYS